MEQRVGDRNTEEVRVCIGGRCQIKEALLGGKFRKRFWSQEITRTTEMLTAAVYSLISAHPGARNDVGLDRW